MLPTSRDVSVERESATLLFVDVQNFNVERTGGEYNGMDPIKLEQEFGYFFKKIEKETLPNLSALQAACRKQNIEVMYTVIQSLTKDGRDRSLDYKITGFNVPPGSWDAEVHSSIKPADDEIILPKSSCSVFVSTHIDYVLRNLGTKYLIICGFLTDQCVESAIRDACDLGYLVTMVTDACATLTEERHNRTLSTIRGFCRQMTTKEMISEILSL